MEGLFWALLGYYNAYYSTLNKEQQEEKEEDIEKHEQHFHKIKTVVDGVHIELIYQTYDPVKQCYSYLFDSYDDVDFHKRYTMTVNKDYMLSDELLVHYVLRDFKFEKSRSKNKYKKEILL